MPLVAGIVGRLVLLATLSLPLTTQQARTRPAGCYAVVMVLDGARPDYFDLTPMPNLRMLAGTTVVSIEHDTSAAIGLDDIAPAIEHLLGARTGPVDGIVLDDALTQQSAEGARAQHLRGTTFDPIVAALQHRAIGDP